VLHCGLAPVVYTLCTGGIRMQWIPSILRVEDLGCGVDHSRTGTVPFPSSTTPDENTLCVRKCDVCQYHSRVFD
jgi:hypothetical protein